jgi:pyrroloquinoline quinone biosynthesis protein B
VKIRILGSAAGGGFPQWNCNCANCDGVRRGTVRATPRTQSSIAASADGVGWILIDASPDILAQLGAAQELQPARALRDTGIVGIVLTDSQIDHTTGLLMLREGAPLRVYCTESVCEDLTRAHPLFRVLEHYCGVVWRRIEPSTAFHVEDARGIAVRPVSLESKAPPYSAHRHDPHEGDTLGLMLTDEQSGKTLFYAPGVRRIDAHVTDAFQRADCILVDGTFFTEDEMVRAGVGSQHAGDMGHLPQSGPGGMIDVLAAYPDARRVLTHINNTNPILDEDSMARAQLDAAGIEVASDGMELIL